MMTITINNPIIENYFHSSKEIEEILENIVKEKQRKSKWQNFIGKLEIKDEFKDKSFREIKEILK